MENEVKEIIEEEFEEETEQEHKRRIKLRFLHLIWIIPFIFVSLYFIIPLCMGMKVTSDVLLLWLLPLACGLITLIIFMYLKHRTSVKSIKFLSIEFSKEWCDVYFNLNLHKRTIELDVKDFAIYAYGFPSAAQSFIKSGQSTKKLTVNDFDLGNQKLCVRFNNAQTDIDRPLKLTFKGKVIKSI